MARRTTSRRTSRRRYQESESSFIRPEIVGTGLLILAGITLLSLFTPNRGTVVTAWLQILGVLIGWGQYIVWLILGLLAVWFFKRYSVEDDDEKWEKPVGAFLVLGMLLVSFHLIRPGDGFVEPGGGGVLGWVLGELLRSALGTPGTVVFLLGLVPLVFILISGLSFRELFQMIRDLYYRVQDWRHFRQLTINQSTQRVRPPSLKPRLIERMLPATTGARSAITAKQNGTEDLPIQVTGEVIEHPSTPKINAPKPLPAGELTETEVDQPETSQRWQLPAVHDIFEEGHEQEISEAEIRQRVKVIEETLQSFGVEAKVREINQGPSVTQFSLEPGYMATKDAKGNPRKVRVSRIVNLSNDLALALSAAPIRMEAPIPGRPYIGLEVPNATKNLVALRTLMDSARFRDSTGILKLALGQDVSGRAALADLTLMPHMLIAGSTGSGKSVCINSIVACMLSTHTPETLRLLMIDPKMVELVNYNGIPHLLAPVVTELEKAAGVLSWATREMDRRYKLFAQEGVRNIIGYNNKVKEQGDGEHMPYIVIIIDELADLMMMAPDEIERTITRIAQMARAVGMHMIIATQRPSVDVVTGLIKANFPARAAFAVSSQIDSRVILDSPGAERLLGKGDMLYMAPDSAKLQRLQGVFVSDKELNRLTRYWRGSLAVLPSSRGPVEIATGLVQQPLWEELKAMEKEKADDKDDEMLERAIKVVREQGKASVSLLQRRLRIGYARAARLVDEMEDQGIIGPDEGGGRARAVLVTQEDDDADPTADEV